MKKYRVVIDYQGGSFGKNRVYTAEEWLEQALDWLDADGLDDESLEEIRKFYNAELEKGNEEQIIDYIATMWDLAFEQVPEK